MLDLLAHGSALVRRLHERRRAIATLRQLGDRHLRDIGLEREMIVAYVAAHLPLPSFEPRSAKAVIHAPQGCG